MKLEIKPGQKLYFTSDTHYNHSNICSATTKWKNGTTREFYSLNEMNDTIVSNINTVVERNDILVHLGDWSFGGFDAITEFWDRLNCKNIILVLGNHDQHISSNKDDIQKLFMSVQDYLYLDIREQVNDSRKNPIFEKTTIICSHYPFASWDGMNKGNIHLHGHCHLGERQAVHQNCRAMDVGMDGHSLMPVSLDYVKLVLNNNPVGTLMLPIDHHIIDYINKEV